MKSLFVIIGVPFLFLVLVGPKVNNSKTKPLYVETPGQQNKIEKYDLRGDVIYIKGKPRYKSKKK